MGYLKIVVFLVPLMALISCVPAETSVARAETMTEKAAVQSPDPAVTFANTNRSGDIAYKEGYFGSGQARLHYVEAGEGPLVILYHGFPSFWYSWFDQMEALKEKYRVVAVDGLGSGLSAKPQNLEPYDIANLAAQLDALSRQLGGDEKYILVGHDWGSVLALSYAQAYPHRLQKVIGMNAPPLNMFLKFLKTSPEQQQRSSYMVRIKNTAFQQLQKTGGGKRIAEGAYANLLKRGDLTPEETALFHDALSCPESMYAAMNWYRANIPAWENISGEDMWPSPDATIDLPTLVIWGEKDRVAVPELVEQLATSSRNLKFVNLPGLNHWTSMEQPDQATKAILDFLAE